MPNFFDQSFIDEVLNRTDIVDVVSAYVRLERRGSKHWGRCPFHNEKTPSFSVDAQKQMFYCFGCHKGGNVLSFIRERERLDFVDAVELLAERAGLEVPKSSQPVTRRFDRDALYEACRKAAIFYHKCLYASEGREALAYLHKRGLDDKIITRFGLGYAPEGNVLMKELEAQGVAFKDMDAAYLTMVKDSRRFDFFRNRVTFPIIDRRGHVIAFGGRVMDQSQPKYLNTPETVIYKKRDQLYGLNLLSRVSGLNKVLIVEGYMDVISLHANGVNYAVASLGTALTENQARLLSRYTPNVLIGYDGDAAGQKGMLRGLDILRAQGLHVKVVRFKDGMDPDDFARAYGQAGVEDAIDTALPLNDYVIESLRAKYDLATPDGRGGFVSACCSDVLAKLESPVDYDIYKAYISRISGVSQSAIDEETGRAKRIRQAQSASGAPLPAQSQQTPRRLDDVAQTSVTPGGAYEKAQDTLLCALLQNLPQRGALLSELRAELFAEGSYREIYTVLAAHPEANTQALMEELTPEAASQVARIVLEEAPEGSNMQKMLQDCIKVTEIVALESRIQAIHTELKEHLTNPQMRAELLKQQFQLVQQKKKLQEQRP